MYIVIEFQITEQGGLSNIVTTHSSKAEAESKFYTILSYAALSGLPLHSAVILTPDGRSIANKCYTTAIEEQID